MDMCGALSVHMCKEAPTTLDSVDGALKLWICVELSVYIRAKKYLLPLILWMVP